MSASKMLADAERVVAYLWGLANQPLRTRPFPEAQPLDENLQSMKALMEALDAAQRVRDELKREGDR